jgi:hypothetical protein
LSARRSASRSEGVRIPKVEDVLGFVSREASWVDIEDLSDCIAEAFSDGINPASRRNQYARSACVDKSHCADDRGQRQQLGHDLFEPQSHSGERTSATISAAASLKPCNQEDTS